LGFVVLNYVTRDYSFVEAPFPLVSTCPKFWRILKLGTTSIEMCSEQRVISSPLLKLAKCSVRWGELSSFIQLECLHKFLYFWEKKTKWKTNIFFRKSFRKTTM